MKKLASVDYNFGLQVMNRMQLLFFKGERGEPGSDGEDGTSGNKVCLRKQHWTISSKFNSLHSSEKWKAFFPIVCFNRGALDYPERTDSTEKRQTKYKEKYLCFYTIYKQLLVKDFVISRIIKVKGSIPRLQKFIPWLFRITQIVLVYQVERVFIVQHFFDFLLD